MGISNAGVVRVDRTLPTGARIRVFAGPDNWIETEAVDQLERVGGRFGMKLAVGLPDLHPGRGHPVGAAFVSEHAVYPALVGNDIGCGMALWRTALPAHARDFDRWSKRLAVLDAPLDADEVTLISAEAERAGWRDSLGTIGGGNHFAELQQVSEIVDEAAFTALELERKRLLLLVHCGSRGLGDAILRSTVRDHGDGPLVSGTYDLAHYRGRHDDAVCWARENRRLVAERFLAAVRTTGEPVLDLVHNAVVALDGHRYLHRKGAAPADGGPVILPGSRGTQSYLLQPTALARETDLCGWSLAHGAGRRWRRSDCRGRMEHVPAESLTRTALGGRVVCADRQLLYEEAPQAYKDVDVVAADLVGAGLATVIAVLKPVLSFKTAGRK